MAFTARTIDEIFKELLLEKQNFTSLNGLNPDGIVDEASLINKMATSKVAEWILWLYNIAVQINITEIRTESAIADLETIISTEKVPTENWYIGKVLEFQYGDNVIVDPENYQIKYEVIDESKQIVDSATIETLVNKCVLKVRRKDTNLFSSDELIALSTYINDFKIPGTSVEIKNYNGDEFSLYLDVIYDGLFDLNTLKGNVENAINEYLNNVESDGYFLTSSLIAKLQSLTGVKYVRFTSGTVIDALSNEVTFIHEYKTNAGWGRIKDSTPLSSTINYIPR